MLGNDLVAKDVLQSQEFQCLSLGEDMSEQTAMQELENLVDEAHLQTDTNDISKMIQYHDNDVRSLREIIKIFSNLFLVFPNFRLAHFKSNKSNRIFRRTHKRQQQQMIQCHCRTLHFTLLIRFRTLARMT